MNLKEIRCEVLEWIHIVQDRVQYRALVITVMNIKMRGERCLDQVSKCHLLRKDSAPWN
jgi:hypothetical protein